MTKPAKWTEVYAQGTPEGADELAFFIAITRKLSNPDRPFLSISTIANRSNLSHIRVEELIEKYAEMGLVVQSSADEGFWGYWENCPDSIKEEKSLAKYDQDRRIKQILDKET